VTRSWEAASAGDIGRVLEMDEAVEVRLVRAIEEDMLMKTGEEGFTAFREIFD